MCVSPASVAPGFGICGLKLVVDDIYTERVIFLHDAPVYMRMNMEEKSNREINPTGGGASPSSLLLSLVVSWTAISIVVISISSYSDTALHFFLLIGSILSILGSSLILTTCATHFRKVHDLCNASPCLSLNRNMNSFTH